MAASSWWEFGEWAGSVGDNPFHELQCAFCPHLGGWIVVAEHASKDPRRDKVLHFDTAKCTNCGNYVLVFLTNPRMGAHEPIYAARQVP
jgi:hypothetical protein